MDIFDSERHAIIARVKAGHGNESEPDGAHVHVELGEFLREVRDYIAREAAKAVDGSAPVPTIPAPDNNLLADAIHRLEKLEAKPPMTPVANDGEAVPRAIGDLKNEIDELRKSLQRIDQAIPQITDQVVTRIETLEKTVPTEPAELQEDLANLRNALLNHTNVLRLRIDACEARFAELPHVLAQVQAERRRL